MPGLQSSGLEYKFIYMSIREGSASISHRTMSKNNESRFQRTVPVVNSVMREILNTNCLAKMVIGIISSCTREISVQLFHRCLFLSGQQLNVLVQGSDVVVTHELVSGHGVKKFDFSVCRRVDVSHRWVVSGFVKVPVSSP